MLERIHTRTFKVSTGFSNKDTFGVHFWEFIIFFSVNKYSLNICLLTQGPALGLRLAVQ